MQRKVGQPGVFADADAVLTTGATAVAQFQISELAAAGVGDERGQPQPVGVGEPQLCPGVRALLADDDPHPRRPPGQIQEPGELDDPGTVARRLLGVVGALAGTPTPAAEDATTASATRPR